MHTLSLFIFRRDLRLEDNIGLIEALKGSKQVIPCFILNPEQLTRNPYRSDRCVTFMMEALGDLNRALKGKLYIFEGKPSAVVANCLQKLPIDAVYMNRDYTPYSIKRDKQIKAACKKAGVPLHLFDDALLNPPEDVLKNDGKPYTMFTPFFNKASQIAVQKPQPNRHTNYFRGKIPFSKTVKASKTSKREACKKLLHAPLTRYPENTTHLSPYLKFTIYSPREIYWKLAELHSKHHPVIRQLYWRDFFTSIAAFFPHVFRGAFHKKYNRLWWNKNRALFKRWCDGKTGFPIVDAAMRELTQTGSLSNRHRMIVASFLIKDLHIDWRLGEKYFAQQLIDYDPSLNNGNWQWVASTGADAQPYFRIFNPWTQQKKFDPSCTYIKKWLPELASLSPATIHTWHKTHSPKISYPAPIVDHATEAKTAIHLYRTLK
jgi:deoxyribodipyrimidine photo-lyase